MAQLKIYTFPDLVLRKKAKPIQRVERGLYSIAESMLETMYGAPGVGLAANQVGLLERIIVVDVDYSSQEEVPRSPQVMINPEISYHEGMVLNSEGCLSVPEFQAKVKRWEKIRFNYLNLDGIKCSMSAEGLLAICIQHEIDHLEGRLFIDHLSPLQKEAVKKRLKRERLLREGLQEKS